MHAARQRRYRAKVNKVTHQGSPKTTANDPLPVSSAMPETRVDADLKSAQIIRCHFCRRECGPFLRHDPLRRPSISDRSELFTTYWLPGVRAQAP